MTERVAGKVCLVTGAAGGIGGAIAKRLGSQGASVVVADIDRVGGERRRDVMATEGSPAIFVDLDVTQEDGWTRAVELAQDRFGGLDVLVNAAGVFGAESPPIDALSWTEWRRVMSINLDGAFLGIKAAIPAMRGRGGGSIINIGSVAGRFGATSGAAYGTSKGGLRALTQQAAYSCMRAGYRIRVNAIHPGYVRTAEALSKLMANGDDAATALDVLARRNPSGRPIEADDVAWAAVYLASDESRMVSGSDLVIDDALSVHMPGRAFGRDINT